MKKILFLAVLGLFVGLVTECNAEERIRVGQGSISLQSGIMYIAGR